MMDYGFAARVLVLATLAVWLVADVWLYARGGGRSTISTWVTRQHRRWPWVSFGLGLLMGHWLF